jgi:uncharacterized protein (TIGR02271 family)
MSGAPAAGSEEELHVGTASRERGRARLRKYIVTEEVHQTVPVQREEVRVEREPITDANIDRATDGPAISDEVRRRGPASAGAPPCPVGPVPLREG